jgi:hypothetical protein
VPVVDYNATLWVLREGLAMACFRVHTDSAGRMTGASVADFTLLGSGTGFDQVLRQRLAQRYGEQCEIFTQVDGGAGVEIFRRGGLPEPPKPPEGPAKQERRGL